MPERPDDVELGDLEHEAFLPTEGGRVRSSKQDNVFIRSLPSPIRGFVKNLSRMKVRDLGDGELAQAVPAATNTSRDITADARHSVHLHCRVNIPWIHKSAS